MNAAAISRIRQSPGIEKELSVCDDPKSQKETLIRFCRERGITSVLEIGDTQIVAYRQYLLLAEKYSPHKAGIYMSVVRHAQFAVLAPKYGALLQEMESYDFSGNARGWIETFFMLYGVETCEKIDYQVRKSFDEYCSIRVADSVRRLLLDQLDRLKLQSIRRKSLTIRNEVRKYQAEEVFLPYYSDYAIASRFGRIDDPEELFFDFTLPASEKLKREIFREIFILIDRSDAEGYYHIKKIRGLSHLYRFCVIHKVAELGQLGARERSEYIEYLASIGKKEDADRYQSVFYTALQDAFLFAAEPNWNADIWFLGRFDFKSYRINLANPCDSIRFDSIEDKAERKLVKDYAKYLLGVTDISVDEIRRSIGVLNEYDRNCRLLGLRMTKIGRSDFPSIYALYFKDEDSMSNGRIINRKLRVICRFYRYLDIHGMILEIPFDYYEYANKELDLHHDRSVPDDIQRKLLASLGRLENPYRLMFLHLWALGLRLNEVCQIRGDAYFVSQGDTWIRVWQNKMKSEKAIPIPYTLYSLMRRYIEEENIRSDEYIFYYGNRRTPMRAKHFCNRMTRFCEETGISTDGYRFRSHDFRHTIAGKLHNQGISIPVIREYLGHQSEEMTKQYIDYVPGMIDSRNEEFFKGRSLMRNSREKNE